MSEMLVADVVIRMRLDLLVLGECRRLLVSRVLFNAVFVEQSMSEDVLDPDFTSDLVYRGVPVVHSMDLQGNEYAFVSE